MIQTRKRRLKYGGYDLFLTTSQRCCKQLLSTFNQLVAVSYNGKMAKCDSCNKMMDANNSITCTQASCTKGLHFACMNPSIKDDKEQRLTWKCPSCKVKEPRANRDNTPIRSSKDDGKGSSAENVTVRRGTQQQDKKQQQDFLASMREEILNTIRSELPKVVRTVISDELRPMNSLIKELEKSVQAMSGMYDSIKKEMDSQASQMQKLKEENLSLHESVNELHGRLSDLENDFSKQEQWARIKNIEVVGVPENNKESLSHIIGMLAEHTGVKVTSDDLVFVNRVQAKRAGGGRPRAIVAQFKERATKDTLLSAFKKCRSITTKDIGMDGDHRKIYINEHLTVKNKVLLSKTKDLAKEAGYKFVWSKNCRIYMRKSENSPFILITKESDLKSIVK